MLFGLALGCACTVLVCNSCRRGVDSQPSRNVRTKPAVTSLSECTVSWRWLKDQAVVESHRGVDLPVQNYRVSGCEEDIEQLTPADAARLADHLDALRNADPAAFKAGWNEPAFHQAVTAELNSTLGHTVIRDWDADLWEMGY